MKNFSAKNAEFETLKINNEAAISSANIGTDPNKIPLNKDLGSLAYQDAVNLDDVSADMLELREIAAEISDSAVDVFVYDTSRDSDGGAWRKRTQHTSWYNEELNTATRGARREFPAVAVIVAEANKVTIYDGDDPDMGMWMVFTVSNTTWFKLRLSGNDCSCISALNGILCAGGNGNGMRLAVVDFVKDNQYLTEKEFTYYNTFISTRNNATTHTDDGGSKSIVNSYINDIAMTVLPNAPIDENTGLPVPTIAVATDGGVSVIKDDGTVVNKATTGAAVYQVKWMSLNRLVATAPAYYGVFDDPFFEESDAFLGNISDNVYNSNPATNHLYQVPNIISSLNNDTQILAIDSRTIIASTAAGLNVHEMGEGPAENNNHGIAAYITSKYNTGWMPGDIKLATLSDTTVENIGVNSDELVTNRGFLADSDWTKGAGWTISGEVASKASSANSSNLTQEIDCVIGQTYVVSWDTTSIDSGAVGFYTLSGGSIIAVRNYYGSVGSYSEAFTATSESVTIALRAGTTAILSIDNISVRATTELITNGDFSNGNDGSWTNYSNANLTVSEISTEQYYLGSNSWKFDTSLANSGISQSHGVYTEQGRLYTLSGYVYSSTGKLWLRWRNGNDSAYIVDNYTLVSGTPNTWLAFSLTAKETASGTLGGIRLVANEAGTFYVDGLSIRPAEEDRSVNNNGLQVIGEINKTKVAPGADLVAYSGFSANNYLVQPYNEDLDFGTGDFCVMGWHYDDVLCGIQKASNTEKNLVPAAFVTGNKFRIISGNNGRVDITIGGVGQDTDNVLTDNTWELISVVRKDGIVYLYKNDSLIQTFKNLNGDVNITNGDLYLGGYWYNGEYTSFSNPNSALLRISATTPTDAQIAKIYRDEKALFQDGAQSTLYGTSDSVTALAYDDSEQLLHVGTASGRSDFRGLARVNNTTTAISNSISAAEGTIIQN